jgi:hypothetical protein
MLVPKREQLPAIIRVAAVWICIASLCLLCSAAQNGASKTAKPARVRAKLDGFDITPKSGKSPNQSGGASRGIGGVTLSAPTVSKAYSLTPTFFWEPDDHQAEYIFRLTQASASQNPLYETKVMGGYFTYPGNAPGLQPGATYVWSVQPSIDMMGGPASASFLIVGGFDRNAIDEALARAKTATDPTAARAKVFLDARVWFDALAEYTALIERYPTRAEFYKIRADLYDQLPDAKTLANADAAKGNR